MRSRMTLRSALVLVAVAGMALGGCAGHGKYTSEHKERSRERAAGMKAANEFEQARQSFMVGELEKALRAVDRSITINPTVARAHVLRGRILIEMGELDGAMSSFLTAEEMEPENVDAQYYLGIVHERYSQTAEALDRFRAAADLEPSKPQYALAVAETLADMGRIDDAEQFLTNRNPSFQHHAGVRQTLGHLAMMRGNAERAAALFHEACLLAPDDWTIVEDLVQAQLLTGRFAEAEYNITRIQNVPEHKDRRDLKQMRARCLAKLDRPLEARELLIELTGDMQGQKDVESWIELGNVCFVLRDMNRVRQASARIVALAPQRPEGYLLRGLMHRRNGDLAASLEAADRAVERRGTSVEPLMLRGLVLRDLGRNDEARAMFEIVARENPSALPRSAVAGVSTDRE